MTLADRSSGHDSTLTVVANIMVKTVVDNVDNVE